MKTMKTKQDSSALVAAFLDSGGKITKCPTKKAKTRRDKPIQDEEVVIVVDDLPEELRKKHFTTID